MVWVWRARSLPPVVVIRPRRHARSLAQCVVFGVPPRIQPALVEAIGTFVQSWLLLPCAGLFVCFVKFVCYHPLCSHPLQAGCRRYSILPQIHVTYSPLPSEQSHDSGTPPRDLNTSGANTVTSGRQFQTTWKETETDNYKNESEYKGNMHPVPKAKARAPVE